MKCANCGIELSPKVYDIHVGKCKPAKKEKKEVKIDKKPSKKDEVE